MTSKESLSSTLRSFQAENPSRFCYLRDYLEPALSELRRYCGEGSIKTQELANKLDIPESDAEELLKALDRLNLANYQAVKASYEFFDFADTSSEDLEMTLEALESDEYLTAIA